MKTIIVPMDFSKESLVGFNYSLMMAKKIGANILMVHVIGKNENTNYDQKENDRQRATQKFEDLIHLHRGKNSTMGTLTYTIKEGKIFEEITNLAIPYNDAMVILSTHGASGFDELFIGGNAYKITSHSKIPVISLRRSTIPSNIEKIVMPLDITFQTREKVPYTVKLAKQLNSEIHLLSIRLSNFSSIEKKLHHYTDQVASYIDSQNVPFIIEHLQGNNLTDITLDYARTVNADLISIMTEQEKSISNILLGSYAHQMINKAYIPVLSFPNYQLRLVTEDVWDLGAFNARS